MAAEAASIVPDHAAEAMERRRDAHLFRGWFIDKFAQLEQALSPVLVDAAARPEFTALNPRYPHLAGQKFERLRHIAEAKTSHSFDTKRVLKLLDQLREFEALRGFLAHGTVETARSDAGHDLFIYRLIRYPAAGPQTDQLVLTADEATAHRKRLQSLIDALISQLSRR